MDRDQLFGLVNDSIRALAHAASPTETLEFVCECTDVECHTMVSLTLREFDERRASSPPAPVLATHHRD